MAPSMRLQRLKALKIKVLEHHIGIHITEPCVMECARQRAHNHKTQLLPQPHGALVGTHHQIELHGL